MPSVFHPEQTLARFFRQIDRSGGPDACWPFAGAKDDGYGTFGIRGRPCRAHRLAYHVLVGPIPDGLHCLHHCDNRACCNPAHLFLGTNADNIQDRVDKRRRGGGPRKLTDDEVVAIRGCYAGGDATMRALAARYGVDTVTIFAVVHRTSHRHVA